jgi:hypothetical protein
MKLEKKNLLYSWLPAGTYRKNLAIEKKFPFKIWRIWVILFMKNPFA